MGNNEFYKRLIDNSQLGYAYHKIVLDENDTPFDFNFIEVNKAFEKILGFKKEDLIGNTLRTIYPETPDEFCDWISFCGDIALTGGNQNIDVYFKTLDKYLNISVHSSEKYYFVVFILDQTLQKYSEKTIQIQNNKYFTLLQNLNGMVYHCENDKNWTMKFVSEGCEYLTGYHPEDLIDNKKLSYNDIILPKYKNEIWKKWQKRLESNLSFESEYEIRTASGEIKWVWERGCGVYNNEGKLMHLEGFITDVTTKKMVEQKLVLSNEKFKSVFNNAADGIVLADRHGVVLSVNNAFEKITGVLANEVIGKSGFLLARKFVSINYLSDILFFIKNVIINNQKNKFELKYNDIYIEIHVSNKTDENTYIAMLRDITERKVSEQLLAEQKDFSEKLIDTSSAIIIGLNEDKKIKIFNAGAERITGYQKNEVLDKDWFDIFIPDAIREQINRVWNKSWGSVSHSYKNVILTKEGKERIVSWQTTGMYDNVDRSKHLIISIGEDITDKQRKDDIIKRNLKYQKMLTEVSSEFVGAYNIDNSVNVMLKGIGSFCSADRSYLFMINDELQTISNTNEWCADGVEPHIQNILNLSLKSFPWWMSKLRNNEIIYVEDVSKMPLEAEFEKKILLAQKINSVIVLPLNVNSKLCGFIGVDNLDSFKGWQFQSIDMLKMSVEILSSALLRLNSEENLKESELYNKALFHYSNIPLVVLDFDTNEFQNCNLAAVKIFGFNTQDEMYGKTAIDVSTVTQYDGGDSVLLMRSKVLEVQRNNSCLFDWRFQRPNGELWDAEVHLMKIKLLEKNLLKVSVLDITEKRKAKEALRLKNLELQERNAELDAFSHTVAHDLKNPLGRILGYADLLSFDYDTTSKVEFKQYIQAIIESGEKTQQIINSLLLFSSVRKAEMKTENIDMSYVIHETIKRLSTEIERSNAQINVLNEFPIVCGFESWIEEVWTNYLTNAMKYSGENPQIDVGFDDENVNGVPEGMIRFWVKDYGPGIPEEKQSIIFKPFERLSQVKTEGHGLGLSIVRRIIEKLGGEVGMKNGNNGGCVFYFTLPRSNCEDENI